VYAPPSTQPVVNGDKFKCLVTTTGACASPSSVWSNEVTVTVNTPVTPSMGIGPSTISYCIGDNITFTASSSYSLSNFQWKLNGSIVGTNSSTYTTNAFTTGSVVTVTATASGSCLATNAVSATSSGIPISINPKVTPGVNVSVASSTICAGTAVTFTATPVNGGSGPTYNWHVNGVSAQNSTSPTFSPATIANGDVVHVVMTSFAPCRTSNTATSSNITMTVNPIQPISVNINQPSPFCGGTGGSVVATVSGPGTFTYTFSWYKNGSPVTGITGPPAYVYAPSSTNPVVNGDKIKCLVTTTGACASPSSVWSNEVTVTVNTPVTPSAGIGPNKITLCEGESITFTASSSFTLSNYQWRLNGNPVGTNSPTYTTTSFTSGSTVTLSATASGGCLATNSVSASSAGIPFTFKPTPNASLSPSGSKKICSDCTETLTANPVGTGHTYQWIKDASNLGSAVTTNTYGATLAGVYTVTVTKDGCSKTSNALTLTKNSKPVVNAGADKTLVLPQNSTTLTGTASDPDGSIASIVWSQLSGPSCTLSGINSLTLSVKGTTSGGYTFRLSATDNFGETGYDDVVVTLSQPANNYNYVRETTILVKDILTYTAANALTIDSKTVNTNYLDGLARPMQQVQTQYSPQKKDLVIPVVYDALGRQARKYLPLPSTENNGNYKSNSSLLAADGNYSNNYYGDSRPYSETTFEPSPLNRPITEYGAGQEWFTNARALGLSYQTNVDGTGAGQEKILRWVINSADMPVRNTSPQYYANGELYVKSTQDEHGNEAREYLDKRGRVVLKKIYVGGTKTDLNNANNWTQTYYVYDIYDQVKFVFQPELSKTLAAGTSDPSATDLFNHAFQYKYDVQHRLIVRQPPSSDPVYMVYDSRNRIVLTQSGNQRKDAGGNLKKEWTYTKYDALNRTIITGLYVHPGTHTTQETMQQYVDTQITTGTSLYEDYNGAAATHGYTNRVFPTSGTTLHTVTYYDNYDFKSLIGNTSYNYLPGELTGQDAAEAMRVTGQVTGSKINVLETTTYLWNVNYYDARYRVIQTVGLNHKNGIDRTTNVYDFVRVKETKTSHSNGSASYSLRNRFEHDHGGRLKKVWHAVNTAPEVLLSQHEYNELSELTVKKLHSRNTGTTFAQKTDFQYNIRGWLRNINDVDAPEKEDLFSLRLNYNTPSSHGGTAQFNGNISEAQWSGAGSDKQIYAYGYDNLNRLVSAGYVNPYRPLLSGRFDEKVGDASNGIQGYDFNGNIKRLFRNGKTNATAFGAMDNLTYFYTGNRLTKVDDAIAANANEGGFRNGTNTGDDYAFDWNGNTNRDGNKGVTAITYNHLNLPIQVNKSASDYVVYRYDATGKKVSQQIFGSLAKVTDYIGEFVYENNALKLILHEEGRIIPNVTAGAPLPWEYQYFLKDHLDNTRVVFSEKKTTSEFLATMERDPVSIENSENAQFLNINNIKKINAPLFNHTAGTGKAYSYRLSGSPGEVIGPAKSFAVNPGETFDLEVYAKYANPSSNGSNVGAILSSLVNAFSLTSSGTGVDGPQALNAFNTLFTPGAYIGRVPPVEDGAAPRAFLNYILFDENFVLQDFGFDQISTAANQPDAIPVAHDYLNLHIKIRQKGFLYVYLSNENPTIVDVFFDDLKVVYNSAVEQTNDYYAFGLTFNNYERTGSVPNNYLYHGNELQDALNLGWLDYGSRMYESSIARWMVTDPMADKFQDISPYAYALNNPVIFIDPDGESPISIFAKQALKYGIKKAAKEFIESQIKKRISEYVGKKVFSRAFAKTLLKDADDLLTTLDSEWWEYVIEVIPVAGDVYGAASLGKKGADLWKGLKKLEDKVQKLGNWANRWGEKGAELIDKTIEGRGKLRDALKLKRGDGKVAHHIIPVTHLENNDVVQAALQAGFDFNGAANGKGLSYDKHNSGGHRKYNGMVKQLLDTWSENKGKKYTPDEAKKFLEDELIPLLNDFIDRANRLE
jgi:RHS repeat-associated protein